MKTLNTVLHIATSVKCPIIALKKVIYTRNAHGGTEGDRKMAEQQLENHYSVCACQLQIERQRNDFTQIQT